MNSRFNYAFQVAALKAACEWGAIPRGRAVLYAKLIKELFAGKPRTDKHLLAVNESFEITAIHRSWAPHVGRFPGIKDKICESLMSGPVLADDENLASSSNKPRNDAFVFLVAGKLLAAGVEVLAVDDVQAPGQKLQWRGDITVRTQHRILDIQCKRPFKNATVFELAQEGAKQITAAVRPGTGFIALDLSRIIRPPGMVLPASSEEEIQSKVDALLEKAYPRDILKAFAYSKIIGLLAFGRVPVMLERKAGSFVPIGASVILAGASKGHPSKAAILKHLIHKLKKHWSPSG